MAEYEYRPAPRDDPFRRVRDYAFRPARGPREQGEGTPIDRSVGEARGLYADGELRSICIHIPLSARIRGGFRDVGGVAAVATPPEHRREGLVGRLLAETLAEYRERGWLFAALWPFDYGFYRQFGWATVAREARVACPVGQLRVGQAHAAGAFRQVGPDEFERLAAVRRAADRGVQLAVDRTEQWWRKRAFRSWGTDPYAYAWERGGETRGYLLYTLDDGEGEMRVSEYGAADATAYLNLLRFCHDHDSQTERVVVREPPDTDLLDIVPDPDAVECEVSPGAMGRVVDVPAALAAIDYPADGALALGVEDPLVEDNDGVFRLDVTDGTATVERTGAPADATLGVGTLSQLLAGYRSAAAAARLGDLDCGEGARETLGALFPPRRVFLREQF